jgi:hypothetical protein
VKKGTSSCGANQPQFIAEMVAHQIWAQLDTKDLWVYTLLVRMLGLLIVGQYEEYNLPDRQAALYICF